MKINIWQKKHLYVYIFRTSTALIRFRQLHHVWLVNCFDGCQHALAKKNIKIAQIKKIIILHDNPCAINGLMGLLSTISLSSVDHRIDIYGPKFLGKYIFWGRKYSRTNFRYSLYFHDISKGIILQQLNFCLDVSLLSHESNCVNYQLIDSVRPGIFNFDYAKKYNIPFGFLYGFLKQGKNFILPDGFVVYSRNFIYGYYLGLRVILINCGIRKRDVSIVNNMVYIIHY